MVIYNVQVPHTASVRNCLQCGGRGASKCIKCKAKRMIKCNKCHGAGKIKVQVGTSLETCICPRDSKKDIRQDPFGKSHRFRLSLAIPESKLFTIAARCNLCLFLKLNSFIHSFFHFSWLKRSARYPFFCFADDS